MTFNYNGQLMYVTHKKGVTINSVTHCDALTWQQGWPDSLELVNSFCSVQTLSDLQNFRQSWWLRFLTNLQGVSHETNHQSLQNKHFSLGKNNKGSWKKMENKEKTSFFSTKKWNLQQLCRVYPQSLSVNRKMIC